MAAPFDPTEYVRCPRVDVPQAFALGVKLLKQAPKKPPPAIRAALVELRTHTVALQTGWRATLGRPKPPDARKVDNQADIAMGALYRRIEEYGTLPADEHPLSARAQELLTIVFDNSLEFLKRDYTTQWGQTEQLLALIDERGLAADLDRIAGPEFLALVRKVHKVYGKAIHLDGDEGDDAALPNLNELLRALTATIGAYTFQVAAAATDRSASEEARASYRRALRPVDALRTASAGKRAPRGDDDEDEGDAPDGPDAPVPDVPPER